MNNEENITLNIFCDPFAGCGDGTGSVLHRV